MTTKKRFVLFVTLTLMFTYASCTTASLAAEQTDAPMKVNDVTDHYGPEIDDFEVLEKLDIDTSVHYRSENEDYDREVSIYSGIRKASNGLRETYKGVVIPSMISFEVKSDVSEEEIFKILRKYFDDTSDDHILISQIKHSRLGKYTYGISRSDSKDLIDYQLAKTVYEEVKAYADVEYFRYVPSYLSLQHCSSGDLEYSDNDYDTIAAYIKDNKLPFNVEITENELGKTKAIVFIENKKETEPIVLREEIYKATGIWGSTPVYYDEGIVTEGKTIDLTDNSDTAQPVTEKTGDIDLNGSIDVTDLTELSLALLGDKELTADGKKAADVDNDGEVTLADLARLRQYLSKVISSLDEPPVSNSFLFGSYNDLSKALTEQDFSAGAASNTYGELFDKTITAFKNNTIDLYVPAIDKDVCTLKNKEGNSNIALMTTDLYKLPWIWYHCKVSNDDVDVRIAYPSVIENPELNSAKTYYEVLKLIAPDAPSPDNYAKYESYQKIYESEICLANGKKVVAMVSELKNKSKVYIMFKYEDALVCTYADKSVLTESFWSRFSLAKYDIDEPEPVSPPKSESESTVFEVGSLAQYTELKYELTQDDTSLEKFFVQSRRPELY